MKRLGCLILVCGALGGCARHTASAPVPPGTAGVHTAALSGVELFHTKGCAYCHGNNFEGVVGKAPSLQTLGKRLKKDAIQRQIMNGGKQMPAFGSALQPDEVAALVDMLSRKKKAPKVVATK